MKSNGVGGWPVDLRARATRGLGRPSLDARSERSNRPSSCQARGQIRVGWSRQVPFLLAERARSECARSTRAVEDHSAPIPKERTSKFGGSIWTLGRRRAEAFWNSLGHSLATVVPWSVPTFFPRMPAGPCHSGESTRSALGHLKGEMNSDNLRSWARSRRHPFGGVIYRGGKRILRR
jgi:hypothetical protein